MRGLIRNLIIVISVAIAFVSYSNESDLKTIDNPTESLNSELFSSSYDFSCSDSEFCFHSRVVSFSAFRLQNLVKRTNPVSKNNLEFLKDGKIINANVLNLIHKNSLIKHCSFIKPIHRLIGLGKLVI